MPSRLQVHSRSRPAVLLLRAPKRRRSIRGFRHLPLRRGFFAGIAFHRRSSGMDRCGGHGVVDRSDLPPVRGLRRYRRQLQDADGHSRDDSADPPPGEGRRQDARMGAENPPRPSVGFRRPMAFAFPFRRAPYRVAAVHDACSRHRPSPCGNPEGDRTLHAFRMQRSRNRSGHGVRAVERIRLQSCRAAAVQRRHSLRTVPEEGESPALPEARQRPSAHTERKNLVSRRKGSDGAFGRSPALQALGALVSRVDRDAASVLCR